MTRIDAYDATHTYLKKQNAKKFLPVVVFRLVDPHHAHINNYRITLSH